jgi:hypothetical protein
LVWGSYRLFENLCKALVARGIIPSVPGGIDPALMIAAIMDATFI